MSPSYSYNNSAAGSIYTFSGTIIPSCTGLRVTGRVNTPKSDSYEASVKELLVYFATAPTEYRWSNNINASSNNNRVAAPGINNGNTTASVKLNSSFWDYASRYEAGGIVWPVAQRNISRVDFINGSLNQYGNGNFTTNLSLQFSTNGSTWTASGWPTTPSYPYNNSAANNTYTFTGTPVANIKGVRVVGRVRTTGSDSYEASLKEVIIYYFEDIGSQLISRKMEACVDIAVASKSALALEVYPNPAYHTLTVYTDDSKAQIVISAMNGEIERQVRGTNTRTLIDIRTLPAGVYSVTVQNLKQNRLS